MAVDIVRAAGGVVYRRLDEGGIEVVLVHRPRYDDWTFPKGKLLNGESDTVAALREVDEETGLQCVLGPELSSTSYIDRRGRPKAVRYWAMTPVAGSFRPNSEVDEMRWIPASEASELLSYDHDHALLDDLETALGLKAPVLLVRHATAGNRKDWKGDDRNRPLDERGRRQAKSLVDVLKPFGVERVITSPYVRCVQTVEPLARAIGVSVEEKAELAEGAGAQAVRSLFRDLSGAPVVCCTHGDVIEEIMSDQRQAKKGSVWILEGSTSGFRPVDYIPPPA